VLDQQFLCEWKRVDRQGQPSIPSDRRAGRRRNLIERMLAELEDFALSPPTAYQVATNLSIGVV
jgi:hypothetical protein